VRPRGCPTAAACGPFSSKVSKLNCWQCCISSFFPPGSTGQQLWELGLVSRLLPDGSLGARTTGLLAVIETPEALEAYLLRAQGQDDAKRRAQRCITAVQEASRLAAGRGWLT
jgi:hypothetical protein